MGWRTDLTENTNAIRAYTRPDPIHKPENYARRAVYARLFLSTVAERVALFNTKVGRQTKICAGQYSFDQVFSRDFPQTLVRKPTAEQLRLFLLAAKADSVSHKGEFTLNAGGTVLNAKNVYHHAALMGISPGKVMVRFYPQHLHSAMFCYTLKSSLSVLHSVFRPVHSAIPRPPVSMLGMHNQLKKATKAVIKTTKRMAALEIFDLLPRIAEPTFPESRVVKIFRAAGNTVLKEEIKEVDDLDTKALSGACWLYLKPSRMPIRCDKKAIRQGQNVLYRNTKALSIKEAR